MRNQLLFFFLSVTFCFTSFSQETPKEVDISKMRRYVPLKFVQKKEIQLTQSDSLSFHFSEGDTLVLITPALEKFFPEGIRVKIKPQDSLFIEKYKAAVYGPMYRNDREKQSLKIWKEIKLYFDPSVPKKHQRELLEFSKRLDSEIDSLSITQVSKRRDANYLVFYRNNADDFDLDPRIENPDAGYYINWEKNFLVRASLKINSFSYEDDSKIINDLKSRFFQTLGHFKYSPRFSCGSLLSNCEEVRNLSEEDLEILKYHYSYQNCIGTALKEFECQHEKRRKTFAEHPYALMYVVHPKE